MAAHHRRSRDAEASAHGGRGSPRDRDAALRARLDAAHVESARGGLGQAPRRHRGRHRDARPAPPPRARAHVWAPELAHPAPPRAERALTEQRWDDASRFGAGRPRSPSRGYLDIPSPRRRRHRHKGLAPSRSNAVEDSRLGRRYFTGRFCPVHNWPVFRCPPRLAVTAYARVEDRTRALSSGFQMHVAKPLEPADLVAAITSLLGKDRGAATAGT